MSSRKAPAQQEIDEEYLRSLMAAPEPAASSSDTEVSEQAETPASEPRVRRSDAEDYASRFLKNTPSEARQCVYICLLYTSPSPRDYAASRMPSSA